MTVRSALAPSSLAAILLFVSPSPSEPAFRLEEATIASLHEAMTSGELTARRLVEMYLARIEAYDQKGPGLNAVILVNPRALERAEELDRERRQSGFVGPLHGIPILLKDNVETADMPTTAGSAALEGFTTGEDAFLVRRLRDAGAIIIAKVNLTEFAASGITRGSLLGQTLNPYDLTRTPGGSSGGTGASVAANFGVAGIGTDTVNSIRSPSSANNLVGIRPTRGLVSRSGVVPFALSQDMAGPIARTVADAATVLEVIAGYDPDDPTTAFSYGYDASYARALGESDIHGARVGVLRSFWGGGPEHAEVSRKADEALDVFESLGAELVELDASIDADELIQEVSIAEFELDAHLSAYLQSRGAPYRSLEEILASGKYEPALKGLYEEALERSTDEREYATRLLLQQVLRERMMNVFARYRLDAVFYPHQKRLVVPIGEDQVDRNGVLASVTGFPALTFPGGFSSATAAAPLGVPIGLELLGPPWSEARLIELARAFEQKTRYRHLPASTPPIPFP